MSSPTFTQPERRSFLAPILIAVSILLAIAAGLYLYLPHRTADITILDSAVFPAHTVFQTDSKLVGQQHRTEDDLYIVLTVRIADQLRIPLFLSDITSTLTSSDGSAITSTAVEKNDLAAVSTAFPAIKPLIKAPLLRETTIQPHTPAQGMVLLHFPLTASVWNNRKSATLTLGFYHQPSITVLLPRQ